jgi:pimeloyl-ACP methyl ester carboxylesterase
MRTVSPENTERHREMEETGSRPLLYDITGTGDPIVLMPGSLSGWLQWIAHADRLAGRHMVVRAQIRSVELVEAGEPVPAGYGITTERDALLSTVDTIGLDRFDLVGWSAGGSVALSFALAYPERVKTLTLIEPAAMWVLRETGHMTNEYREMEAIDRSLAHREITIDDLKAFLVRAGLGTPYTDFEAYPRWPVWVSNRQMLSLTVTEWDHTESLDRLRALHVPVLAVKGTDTSSVLGTIVDDIVASAPRATLLELPGGHACHIENMDRFSEELERHISSST